MSDADRPTAGTDAVPALANELRALRRRAGLTQRDIAGRVNYSHVTVVKAEAGRRPPTWEVVEAIVRTCSPGSPDLATWKEMWRAARGSAGRSATPGGSGPGGSATEEVAAPPVAAPPAHRPDPAAIRTLGGYVAALASLRTGSYRDVTARARSVFATTEEPTPSVARSTVADLFKPDRVWLDWDVVHAYLVGCGVHRSHLEHWRRLLGEVQGWHRVARPRREVSSAPPPAVDLAGVGSPGAFVEALRELTRRTGMSMADVIDRARWHPGAHIYARSAMAARFTVGVSRGVLPERTLVKAYLRGCYCPSLRHRAWCVPDCSADEIAPWLRLYDGMRTSPGRPGAR